MKYQMQEGYFSLEGPWQDQSINVLVPQHLEVKGANIVVARDTLPSGMEFIDYINLQKNTFSKELTGFRLSHEFEESLDEKAAHFLEFNWENQGKTIYQLMCLTHDKNSILSLTGTIPGTIDKTACAALMKVIKSFRFGIKPEDAKG